MKSAKNAKSLKRLIVEMNDHRYWYTGCGDTPGLTYREPALVLVWSGGGHFVVAPRDGPVLTQETPSQSPDWLAGFIKAMCEDPVPIVEAVVRAYKTDMAPAFA